MKTIAGDSSNFGLKLLGVSHSHWLCPLAFLTRLGSLLRRRPAPLPRPLSCAVNTAPGLHSSPKIAVVVMKHVLLSWCTYYRPSISLSNWSTSSGRSCSQAARLRHTALRALGLLRWPLLGDCLLLALEIQNCVGHLRGSSDL